MSRLATDLLDALDPARVMVRAGLSPDPWQRDLLRSTASRMLVLCARQSGKSTCAAALGLYEALYASPALVLLLSPSLRQSQELFRATIQLYTRGGPRFPPWPSRRCVWNSPTGAASWHCPAS